MAEGGFDFGYDDPDLDNKLDDDDNDDSDQEVDTTHPFQPTEASTSYHGGEQHEMKTMQKEKSGLPSYSGIHGALERNLRNFRENPYPRGEQQKQSWIPENSWDETPLLGDLLEPEERQGISDRGIDSIKKRYREQRSPI